MGGVVGRCLGYVTNISRNPSGDFLGDLLWIRVAINVFQRLKRLLKLRLPNGDKADTELLYEKLPAYCFLCGCFNHVGIGCSLYNGGVIDGADAPYGDFVAS